MTTDKAFKRVVRARMAKTGERYAAARRSLVDADADAHVPTPALTVETAAGRSTYRLRGGLHPESATLANVLANQGVVSGLTGEPLTEATIFAIGGGLGAGYILWEFKSHEAPVLTLGFSNQWQYPSIPGWTGKTLERLGIEAGLHETGGAKGAREALDAWLDAGVPVIASVDLQEMRTWGLPDRSRASTATRSSSPDVSPTARTWSTTAAARPSGSRPTSWPRPAVGSGHSSIGSFGCRRPKA